MCLLEQNLKNFSVQNSYVFTICGGIIDSKIQINKTYVRIFTVLIYNSSESSLNPEQYVGNWKNTYKYYFYSCSSWTLSLFWG